MADIEKVIRQMSNENTARTFEFNASEAEKSRQFSEYMSNTSHQREVEDLKRAGLNPVLSANSGAASYSAASASGSADTSAVGLLASIYQTKLNNANAVKIAKINAEKDLEAARISAAASKYASDTSSSASRYSTDHTRYGMIDSFLKGITGYSGSSTASTLGSKVATGVKKAVSWAYKEYSKPRAKGKTTMHGATR